jgi:hypothetical protein
LNVSLDTREIFAELPVVAGLVTTKRPFDLPTGKLRVESPANPSETPGTTPSVASGTGVAEVLRSFREFT